MSEKKRSARRATTIAAQQLHSSNDQPESISPKRRKIMKKTRTRNGDNDKGSGLPQPALPYEVWQTIFSYLFPSQLVQVAATSSAMHTIVSSLSIWHEICETASLPPLTKRAPRNTYYGSAVKLSKLVCEKCYAKCATDGYRAALPVHLASRAKHVNMCLQCRQAHFEQYPEPVEQNYRLREYGGQIGIDAQRTKDNAAYDKKMKKYKEECDCRCKELRGALANIGIELDEEDGWCKPYIKKGKGDLNVTVSIVEQRHKKQRAEEERRNALASRLNKHGVELQNDSVLSKDYISSGKGDLNKIVTTMVEMSWYFAETTYRTSRYYYVQGLFGDRLRCVDSEMGKKEAISNYALQRLKSGKWNDLSTDPDTPARPPKSLWSRITEVLASLWQVNVKVFLVRGLLTNDENLAQAKKLDPTHPDSLSEEFCLKAIEDGATAIVKSYATSVQANKASSPPITSFEPSCSFVSSAKRMLGEEKFVARLIAIREDVLARVKESYMEKKKSEPPSGLVEFIDECNKHDPPLTNQQYYYRRKVFARKQIPAIAEDEGVHPQYMLELLKSVKGQRVKTSNKN